MALSLVTIVALAGRGGQLARRTAMVFAGLLLLLGLAAIGVSIWSAITPQDFIGVALAAGIIIALISGATILVLRKRPSTDPTGLA